MIEDPMLAASFLNLTKHEMRWIRNNCTNNIRKSYGFILFEKALAEEQKYYNP